MINDYQLRTNTFHQSNKDNSLHIEYYIHPHTNPDRSRNRFKNNTKNKTPFNHSASNNYIQNAYNDLYDSMNPNREYYEKFLTSLTQEKKLQKHHSPKERNKKHLNSSPSPNKTIAPSFFMIDNDFRNIKRTTASCFKNNQKQGHTPKMQTPVKKKRHKPNKSNSNIEVISPQKNDMSPEKINILENEVDFMIKLRELNENEINSIIMNYNPKDVQGSSISRSRHFGDDFSRKQKSRHATHQESQDKNKDIAMKVVQFQNSQTECKNEEIPKQMIMTTSSQLKPKKKLWLCCIPISSSIP